MKTTKGKLRNITTGILHTNIGDVYSFLEDYTKEKGIMTHHLGSACKALKPFLEKRLSKEWFTDEWQKEGLIEIVELEDLSPIEKKDFFDSFGKYASELWDVIKDKTIIAVIPGNESDTTSKE